MSGAFPLFSYSWLYFANSSFAPSLSRLRSWRIWAGILGGIRERICGNIDGFGSLCRRGDRGKTYRVVKDVLRRGE